VKLIETETQTELASSRSGRDLMFSLLGAAAGLEARLESALAGVDLSLAKLGVLTKLVEASEPLPLGELAVCQKCVRSNMTQLVDRLEADGLVRRVDDPRDRRVVLAELTSLGRERQAEGARQLKKIQGEFTAQLEEIDRGTLERALRRLA
jgi:DNA-binding MarR family transcriptional regulator